MVLRPTQRSAAIAVGGLANTFLVLVKHCPGTQVALL
jgi:hypothetical protein